jgi:hypothetical protein
LLLQGRGSDNTLKNKIHKVQYGPINLVQSIKGISFMVDTRQEMNETHWDDALSAAWRSGYELDPDTEPKELGVWEIWDLTPVRSAA